MMNRSNNLYKLNNIIIKKYLFFQNKWRGSLFLFLIFCSLFISAQPVVKTIVDKTKIKIGEPITIQLTVTWPNDLALANGFTIPDSIAHFEIWDKPPQTAIKNGIEQRLTLTSFDSGQHTIPSFMLNISPNSNSVEPMYYTDSIRITVMPVNVDSLRDYHDIKDIIEIPSNPQWPYVVAIAGITFISLMALYFLLKKQGFFPQNKNLIFTHKNNPYITALNELKKLEEEIILHPKNAKMFFTQLTIIYRTYLQNGYNFRSYQKTGDELILHINNLVYNDLFFLFANTIRLSDAVKFAKYEPPENEWGNSIQAIRQTIESLEQKRQTFAQSSRKH